MSVSAEASNTDDATNAVEMLELQQNTATASGEFTGAVTSGDAPDVLGHSPHDSGVTPPPAVNTARPSSVARPPRSSQAREGAVAQEIGASPNAAAAENHQDERVEVVGNDPMDAPTPSMSGFDCTPPSPVAAPSPHGEPPRPSVPVPLRVPDKGNDVFVFVEDLLPDKETATSDEPQPTKSAVPWLEGAPFREFAAEAMEAEYMRFVDETSGIGPIVLTALMGTAGIFIAIQAWPMPMWQELALLGNTCLIWTCAAIHIVLRCCVRCDTLAAAYKRATATREVFVFQLLAVTLLGIGIVINLHQGERCEQPVRSSIDLCPRALPSEFILMQWMTFILVVKPHQALAVAIVCWIFQWLTLTARVDRANLGDVAFPAVATALFLVIMCWAAWYRDKHTRTAFTLLARSAWADREVQQRRRGAVIVTRAALPWRVTARFATVSGAQLPSDIFYDASASASVCVTGAADYAAWASSRLMVSNMSALHHLFTMFDEATDVFGVDQATTFGDEYVVTSGLLRGSPATWPGPVLRFGMWQVAMRENDLVRLKSAVAFGHMVAGLGGSNSLRYMVGGRALTDAMALFRRTPAKRVYGTREVGAAVRARPAADYADIVLVPADSGAATAVWARDRASFAAAASSGHQGTSRGSSLEASRIGTTAGTSLVDPAAVHRVPGLATQAPRGIEDEAANESRLHEMLASAAQASALDTAGGAALWARSVGDVESALMRTAYRMCDTHEDDDDVGDERKREERYRQVDDLFAGEKDDPSKADDLKAVSLDFGNPDFENAHHAAVIREVQPGLRVLPRFLAAGLLALVITHFLTAHTDGEEEVGRSVAAGLMMLVAAIVAAVAGLPKFQCDDAEAQHMRIAGVVGFANLIVAAALLFSPTSHLSRHERCYIAAQTDAIIVFICAPLRLRTALLFGLTMLPLVVVDMSRFAEPTAIQIAAVFTFIMLYFYQSHSHLRIRRLMFLTARRTAEKQPRAQQAVQVLTMLTRQLVPPHMVVHGGILERQLARLEAEQQRAIERHLRKDASVSAVGRLLTMRRQMFTLDLYEGMSSFVAVHIRLQPQHNVLEAMAPAPLTRARDGVMGYTGSVAATSLDGMPSMRVRRVELQEGTAKPSWAEDASAAHIDQARQQEGDAFGADTSILRMWSVLTEIAQRTSGGLLQVIETLGDEVMIGGPFGVGAHDPQADMKYFTAAHAAVLLLRTLYLEGQLCFTAGVALDEACGVMLGRGSLRYRVFGEAVRQATTLVKAAPTGPGAAFGVVTENVVRCVAPMIVRPAVARTEARSWGAWTTSLYFGAPQRWRIQHGGFTRVFPVVCTRVIGPGEEEEEVLPPLWGSATGTNTALSGSALASSGQVRCV